MYSISRQNLMQTDEMVPEPRYDAEPNERGGSMTAAEVGASGRRSAPRLAECSEGAAKGEAGACRRGRDGEERSSMLLSFLRRLAYVLTLCV